MNEHPSHLDRETAEQLLDGASATLAGDPSTERLARLLAAAGGPPRPADYSREEEAMMAFRAAASAPRRKTWRRLLTFKVLAVTATVTVGGLAFASTTGIIPGPFKQETGVSTQPPAATSGPGRSHARTTPAPPSAPASPPAPGFAGLCNSYLKKDQAERSKALNSPPYAELVAAAGGQQNVEAYCHGLPGKDKPEKSHDPKPTHQPGPPRATRR